MTTSPSPDQLFAGISATTVTTDRCTANVLQTNPDADGTAVVFIHGNVSSSLFWQPTMVWRWPACGRSRSTSAGSVASPASPVDATRGLRDFSDDVLALLDDLAIDRAALVGWSLGGGVAMQALLDRPTLVSSMILVSPVSPYGFGGTTAAAALLTGDAAGTGGGGVNPDFVQRLIDGDATDAAQTSPRSMFRAAYVAPGYTSEHEDLWVASMLSTVVGPDSYPGDGVPSDSWPGFAAGGRGVLNTLAPTHCNLTGIVDLAEKPPVLWVRGALDAIVSDSSFYDLNTLGQAGILPGWPGIDIAPPQPMVSQTRAVLDAYAAAGGSYRELVFDTADHSAHLERPDEFVAALRDLID